MFADDGSPIVDIAFVIAVALAGLGAVAVIVAAYLGRLRHVLTRLVHLVPLVTLLGLGCLVAAFDQSALADRGIEVRCEVVGKEDYVRGSGTARVDHEFACQGRPSFQEDTNPDEQYSLGEDVIVTIDPLDRAGPMIGQVSATGGTVAALFGVSILAATVVGRLHAVDDGSIKAAHRRFTARRL